MRRLSTYINSADKLILIVIFALGVISALMIGSTEYSKGFFSREVIVQAVAFILGFILIFAMCQFNYRSFLGLEKKLYIISLLLLLSVYIPGLGVEEFGSRAWITLGFTTVQPSEFVKVLYIIIMASYFAKNRDTLHNFRGLIKSAIVAAPILIIVLKEDLGSALVFASIWLAMLFFAGIDHKVLGKFLLLVLAAIPVAYLFLADYQKERIESFLHPDNFSFDANYQVWESKIAIGSGGIFGKGLFQGSQKELEFIPVQKSDFIFSVICEELGLFGGLLVIVLYGLMLYRLTKMIKTSYDMYGALIIVGAIGIFTFQVFENIAMTMGIMPVTGITLPFMSSGGSSVVANMLVIGLVINVSINNKEMRLRGRF